MRYAAEQAGIGGGGRDGSASEDASPSRLVLALEPEAAAIAAVPGVRKALRCTPLSRTHSDATSGGAQIRKLGHTIARGDRVMIVDAG